MGNEADRKLMRMGAFSMDAELARIWVPDDFKIAEADLAWVVGLDVFVAPYCEASRLAEFMVLLWRARPATLWQLDAGFTATRLYAWPKVRGGTELTAHYPCRVPLDESFRPKLESAREMAMMGADAPLFDAPAFATARAKRWRELGVVA